MSRGHSVASLILAGVATVALSALASAGGSFRQGPEPKIDWSGLYFGGHVGGAWSDTQWGWDVPTLPTRQDVSAKDSDVAAGVQLGLQQQWGNVVAGVEVSYTSTHTHDDQVVNFQTYDRNFTTDVSSLVLVDARLGYADGRWLGYVKGGYANAEVQLATTRIFDGLHQTYSKNREGGWNIGGGLEYALSPSVIVGVEYNYIDLGSADRSGTELPGTIGSNHLGVDPQIQTVTARYSIKLGPREEAIEPLK